MPLKLYALLALALTFGAGVALAQELGQGRIVAYYAVDGVKVKEWIPYSRRDMWCVHTTSIMGADLQCYPLPAISRRAR
jgi:hypothetical protein